MPESEEKSKLSPELDAIGKADSLVRSGRVSGVLSASSSTVEGKVRILELSEQLDAQTLKLTVTI
jgi:hypothetical protein